MKQIYDKAITSRLRLLALALVVALGLGSALALVAPSALAWAEGDGDSVLNERTGATYATLAEAVEKSGEGDRLLVLRDIEFTEPVAIERPVEIDLNEKTVRFALPKRGTKADTSVIAFVGKGEYSLENGDVAIEGSDPVLPASRGFALQGVEVSNGANLALVDVHMEMRFERTEKVTVLPVIAGVAVKEGTASLSGKTSVAVKVGGCYPAEVHGARVFGKGAASAQLEIGSEAQVAVANASERSETGEVSRASSITSLSPAFLMEFFPAEDSLLRQSIAQQFVLKARADVAEDTEGYVHGAGLYYAAPLKFSDGGYVWAFSDPVAANDRGSVSAITPKRFFGQSRYDCMPLTYGVRVSESGEDAEARAIIRGAVQASSSRGDAVAVAQEDGGAIAVEACAKLSSQGASDPYRSLVGSLTAATLSEKAPSDAAFYPTNKSVAHEVRWTQTHSVCVEGDVAVEEGSSLSDEQWGDEPPVPTDLPDIGEIGVAEKPETVTVNLYHWRPLGTQTVYAYTQRTLGFGASVTEEAANLVKPGAVAYHGDKVETFLGWSPRRSDTEPLFTDGLPAATENASYFAIYSQRERRVSVTFMVDGAPYATAEDMPAGKTVDAAFKASSNSKRPGPDSAGNLFRGWSLTPGGTPVSHVVKTLAELAQGEEPLTLYAVYYEPVATNGSTTPGNSDQGGKPSGTSKPNASGNSSKPGASGSSPKPATASPKGPALPASGLKRPLAAAASARPAAAGNAEEEDGAAVLLDEGDGPDGGDGEAGPAGAAASEDPLSDVASGEAIEEGEAPAASPATANTVGFFGIVVALVIAAAWGVFRVVRNRRLDRLEDYYEPELAGGREVCF